MVHGSLLESLSLIFLVGASRSSLEILLILVGFPLKVKRQGSSKPHWGRSAEYLRLPLTIHVIVPLRNKKVLHTADIFLGTCPNNEPWSLTAATAYRSDQFLFCILELWCDHLESTHCYKHESHECRRSYCILVVTAKTMWLTHWIFKDGHFYRFWQLELWIGITNQSEQEVCMQHYVVRDTGFVMIINLCGKGKPLSYHIV